MRTGTGTGDITPRPGIELSGFLARVQPSVGIHDRLFTRALFLDNGPSRLLWLHSDLIGFDYRFAAAVKQQLLAQCGLRAHEIVLSATHTHSGPATVHLINCGEVDPDYLEWLPHQLITAAQRAMDRTEETQLVSAVGHCPLAIDRRGRPSAHVDPRVGVIAWQRRDGSYVAVLANYAVHNVAMGHQNYLISADIFGQAAATAAQQLRGTPTVLITNGPCGNLNPPAVGSDFIQMQQWGEQLGNTVVTALSQATPTAHAALASVTRTMDIALTPLQPEELAAHATRLRDVVGSRTGYLEDRYRDAVQKWESAMSASAQPGRKSLPLELQVVSIGGVLFTCCGAEVFSIMADQLRERTSRSVYVVSYANGVLGYLAPAAAYAEGGYEVDSAFVFYGTLPIQPGGFEQVCDQAVDLIRLINNSGAQYLGGDHGAQ